MKRPIYFFKDYLINVFGKGLHRIPLDLGLGCPHRPTTGGGGCAFCPGDGAKARHLGEGLDLDAQLSAGVDYVRRRYDSNGPYIAYFQSFSNTNAPCAELRRLYQAVLGKTDFRMAIIATRPDCLPPEVIDLLADLGRQLPLWVEIGIQTANDQTLAAINRGHDFACSANAVRALSAAGIKTAAHVILGLPGESRHDHQATAARLNELPLNGIKIHNLLVLRNTPLATAYRDTPFPVLDEFDYATAVIDFLRRIPPTWPVMRLNTDAPRREIIAPHWQTGKAAFIQMLVKTMLANEMRQGDLVGGVAHPA